jgi:hypothetical protein
MPRPTWRLIALALVLLSIPAAGLFTYPSDDHPDKPTAVTVTVTVDGLDAGKAPDRTVEVPAAVIKQAAPKVHDQLADETPAGVPARELDAAAIAEQKIADTQDPLPTGGATQGFAGCRTSFVANQSSRRGVRPQVQVLHYTVSPNRPGWSDVDAIVALFDRPSFQASSNFVIDSEGHCAYIVPIEAKAWTQAAGNPFSVSYEIVATGREARYLEPAGMAKLKSVVAEVHRRTGIPLRRGSVSGCVPTRTGIIDHTSWGTCGGGHSDIGPFDVGAVVKQIVAGTGVTAVDRVTCRKLNWWRANGRPGGQASRNAVRRRRALDARQITCTANGPVKR